MVNSRKVLEALDSLDYEISRTVLHEGFPITLQTDGITERMQKLRDEVLKFSHLAKTRKFVGNDFVVWICRAMGRPLVGDSDCERTASVVAAVANRLLSGELD